MNHEYVIQAQRRAEQQKPSLTQLAISRAPNYLHPDGRIYTSKPGEPYVAVSVSPYNPKFRTQIEDGIAPVVMGLVNKGYLTLSSCEGHSISFSYPYVIVAFGEEQKADAFRNYFSLLPWTTTSIRRSVANVVQDGSSFKRMQEPWYNTQAEYEELNRMFHRDYDQYWFVTISLFETRRGIFNALSNFKTERLRKRFLRDGLLIWENKVHLIEEHIG